MSQYPPPPPSQDPNPKTPGAGGGSDYPPPLPPPAYPHQPPTPTSYGPPPTYPPAYPNQPPAYPPPSDYGQQAPPPAEPYPGQAYPPPPTGGYHPSNEPPPIPPGYPGSPYSQPPAYGQQPPYGQGAQPWNPQPPAPQGHSYFGIASIVFAGISVVLAVIGFAVNPAQDGGQPDPTSPATIASGFLLLGAISVSLIGLVLGIVGLLESGKNKIFAYLGIGFNLLPCLCFGGLFLLGIVLIASGAVSLPT